MTLKYFTVLVVASAVLAATPVVAKQKSAKGKGFYCYQGGQNFFVPAANFLLDCVRKCLKGKKLQSIFQAMDPLAARFIETQFWRSCCKFDSALGSLLSNLICLPVTGWSKPSTVACRAWPRR